MSPSPLLPVVILAVTASLWLRAWASRRRLELRLSLLQLLGLACARGAPLPPLVRRMAAEFEGRRRLRLERLHGCLEAGDPLAQALERSNRRTFTPGIVAAVEAAHGTDRAADTLQALAREDAVELRARHRLGLALLYPAILVLLVVGLDGWVHRCLGADWHRHWFYRSERPVEMAAFAALWLAVGAVALWALSKLVRTYDLGPGARARAGVRLLRLGSILAGAGLSVPEALRRAAHSCRRRDLRRGAGETARRLEEGERSARAWEPLRLPKALALRMGALGARLPANVLAELSERLALGERTRRERLLRWVQPAAVLLIAAVVLFEYAWLMDFLEQARETAREPVTLW